MNSDLGQLEPKILWRYFADLNEVPRPSKKEDRVIEFMKAFGESLNLPTEIDEAGNVIIKKPASPGMEDRMTVVLQSHLDMVHQKNAGTDFDFENEGIKMYIEGDWVKAKGTTLGADNGIGVAAIMAVLASDEIVHPPIEALFTIDEETGMTGAKGLKGGLLQGDILLNLDTEDDDELTIGCAGGIDITATGSYSQEKTASDHTGYQLTVKGLSGGHSGMDIKLGRANANKMINRLLWQGSISFGLRVHSIDGGGLRNAIPREAAAAIAIPGKQTAAFENYIEEAQVILRREYEKTDPDLSAILEKTNTPEVVINKDFQSNFLRAVYASHNGIYRMSPEMPELVQTSNNLARIELNHGEYHVKCLTRSSVDTEKTDLANAIKSAFELMGATVELSGDYPGWTPRPEAAIVSVMRENYIRLFEEKPKVTAVHAGLECGILGRNYPEMEMISFGPNIRGAHSPDERVQISSVQKFWKLYLETLKNIPSKNGLSA